MNIHDPNVIISKEGKKIRQDNIRIKNNNEDDIVIEYQNRVGIHDDINRRHPGYSESVSEQQEEEKGLDDEDEEGD
jgi:hypothetical protein